MKDVARIRMISPEEEVELSQQLKGENREAAKKRLIEGNLRFVISCAKHFQNQGLSLADLVAEGNIGLIRAAELYDPDKGVKFISYAVNWIEQAMIEALCSTSRTVRLPVSHLNEKRKIYKTAVKLEQEYGREASMSEIGDELDMDPTKVSRTISTNSHCVSLDTPFSTDQDGTDCLLDIIPNKNASAEKEVLDKDNKARLDHALSKLPPRSRCIIRMCFGLDDKPITLEEIGDYFGLTSERIRQLKDEALIDLRKYLNRGSFNK